MDSQLGGKIRLLALALGLAVLSELGIAVFVFVVVSVSLIPVWVGVPMAIGSVALNRWFADAHRGVAASLLGRPVPRPYVPLPRNNWLARFRTVVTDPATWRDLVWLLLNAVVGLAIPVVVVSLLASALFYLTLPLWWRLFEHLGTVDFIGFIPITNEASTFLMLPFGALILALWWWGAPRLMYVNALLTAALLGPTETRRLTTRVAELSESRADVTGSHAAELRRIERDLHDGAQARLVALGMNLGMAEEVIAEDPETARQLLAEARESTTSALAELRGLVRGIHPPVLADRGLDGALRALALASPVPVEVAIDLPGRPPQPVESAVYFAVAEALTNTAKYGAASSAWLRVSYSDDRLVALVGDDGHGGAQVEPGGGLHGLERRLAAFDGTLLVTSPLGGPTVVYLEVPCELAEPESAS